MPLDQNTLKYLTKEFGFSNRLYFEIAYNFEFHMYADSLEANNILMLNRYNFDFHPGSHKHKNGHNKHENIYNFGKQRERESFDSTEYWSV